MMKSNNLLSQLNRQFLLSVTAVLLFSFIVPISHADDGDIKKFAQDALSLAKAAAEKKANALKQYAVNAVKRAKEQAARKQASIKRHSELLKKRGVGSTPQELHTYLDGLFPNSETEKKIRQLIQQMGDADFFKREEAMTKLLGAPSVPMHLINQAAESKADLEIRWRARHIREVRGSSSKEILFAVYQLIHLREDKGLAQPVLKSFAYCQQQYLKDIAASALISTAELKDQELLRKTILSKETELVQKIASITSLELILKEKADADLKPLLSLPDETIRMTAATAMLNHGTRDGLIVLVDMLESESIKTRLKAVQGLRLSTGHKFNFIAYDAPDKRKHVAQQWKNWITANAKTAKLNFPLPVHRKGGIKFNRTLVAYYSRNMVVEYDSTGKETWKQSVNQPWGCQGLENGNRLVLSRGTSTIYEYDTSGKLIWSMSGLPRYPSSCQRLENGNTLIACSSSNKVIEVTHEKKTVWEATIQRNPVNAQRLENGRTLITLQSSRKVIEIDAQGKVVWEVNNLNNPYSARRLENGNTLICATSSQFVAEYDRAGKIVWKKTGVQYPYDAQRLENGNTLIGDQRGAKEYDSSGKIIWQPQGNTYGAVMRISRF